MRKDERRPEPQGACHGDDSGGRRLPYEAGGAYELPRALVAEAHSGAYAAADALRSELRGYERAGTHLYLDGHPGTADEIARACLLSEDSAYMRDFIGDEHECITEIHFIKIAEDQVFQERKSSR